MELTTRQKETLRYVEDSTRAKTISSRADAWVANVAANRKHFIKGQAEVRGLTVFVVAAGPSLKKNVADLKRIGRLGVTVVVDAAYRFVVEQGIVPDYCISIDSDGRMVSMIEGAPTKDTTLVTLASASPALVDYWQGPKWFARAIGGEQDLDDKLHAVTRQVRVTKALLPGQILDPLTDIAVDFPGLQEILMTGGNVTGCAHSFAHAVLRSVKIVFVGADYAWDGITAPDEFYAGGAHKDLAEERLKDQPVSFPSLGNGLPLQTNFSMFAFKRWHEDVAKAHGSVCVNATEGGILGVGAKGEALPGWEMLSLREAIARYAPGGPA